MLSNQVVLEVHQGVSFVTLRLKVISEERQHVFGSCGALDGYEDSTSPVSGEAMTTAVSHHSAIVKGISRSLDRDVVHRGESCTDDVMKNYNGSLGGVVGIVADLWADIFQTKIGCILAIVQVLCEVKRVTPIVGRDRLIEAALLDASIASGVNEVSDVGVCFAIGLESKGSQPCRMHQGLHVRLAVLLCLLFDFFFGHLWRLVIATLDDRDVSLAALLMASAPLSAVGEIIGSLGPHARLHETVEVVPFSHGLLTDRVHQVDESILCARAVHVLPVQIMHSEASFVEIVLHHSIALSLRQALHAGHDGGVVRTHFLNQERRMCVCQALPVADGGGSFCIVVLARAETFLLFDQNFVALALSWVFGEFRQNIDWMQRKRRLVRAMVVVIDHLGLVMNDSVVVKVRCVMNDCVVNVIRRVMND